VGFHLGNIFEQKILKTTVQQECEFFRFFSQFQHFHFHGNERGEYRQLMFSSKRTVDTVRFEKHG
jgi:hypothetical protein